MNIRKSIVVQALALATPWPIRRRLLRRFLGFHIAPTARLGLSLVLSERLTMEQSSKIGHLTVLKGMAHVEMGEASYVGNLNWIYAIPSGSPFLHHESARSPNLVLMRHSSINNRHIIDCSAQVTLEPFSILAGVRSLVLTHAADISASRVKTQEITLGAYSMVGSGCVLLGGAVLPARSLLGAGSTLRTAETTPFRLYSGVPAKPVADLDPDAPMFHREKGSFRT